MQLNRARTDAILTPHLIRSAPVVVFGLPRACFRFPFPYVLPKRAHAGYAAERKHLSSAAEERAGSREKIIVAVAFSSNPLEYGFFRIPSGSMWFDLLFWACGALPFARGVLTA